MTQQLAQEMIWTAADTGDSDPFPLELFDRVNFGFRIEPYQRPIKRIENHSKRSAAKHGAERSGGHGAEIDVLSDQRKIGDGRSHDNQIDIESLVPKKAPILSYIKWDLRKARSGSSQVYRSAFGFGCDTENY